MGVLAKLNAPFELERANPVKTLGKRCAITRQFFPYKTDGGESRPRTPANPSAHRSPRPQDPDAGCRLGTPLLVRNFRDLELFQILLLKQPALFGIAQAQNPLQVDRGAIRLETDGYIPQVFENWPPEVTTVKV
jgi:hypothetical protein